MKKNLTLGVTLCALVVTGCSSLDEAESGQPEQGAPVNVTINATRHETPSTRTEYEEGTNKLIVKWKSDKTDILGIFTSGGENSNVEFKVEGNLSNDGKSANFEGTLNLSDLTQETTVYGYYPRVENGSISIDPTAISISLSNPTQTGITDEVSLTHLADKDYMAATPVTQKLSEGSNTLSLAFNPLLTILSFEIEQEMTVESIELEAVRVTNPTPFYTDGTVDITNGTFPITYSGTSTNAITLNVMDGQIAAGSSGMFNMMIFPIERSSMPTQFKVIVTTADGKVYTQTKDAPKNGFVRGKRSIMKLGGLTEADDIWGGKYPKDGDAAYKYSGGDGSSTAPYQIATAADLAQFAVNVNKGSTYYGGKYFTLTKNIDLNNHEWIPIGNFSNSFQGTFDGGGKAITGMRITRTATYLGLFGYMKKGTIKDIEVAGEISKSSSSNGSIYAGGIIGSCQASLSGNLTNRVNITIKYGGPSSLKIGGVVGHLFAANDNFKLFNYGTLKIEGGTVEVGGVIGALSASISGTTSLTNEGAVSGSSGVGECYVGGLIGNILGEERTAVFNGTNTGEVMGKTTGTGLVCSGGSIGCMDPKASISGSFQNTGAVTAENTSTGDSYAGIRVGGADGNLVKIVEFNEDNDGNSGSAVGVTATATTGKRYVNGVLQ